jgi:hypothetical protein
MSNGWYLVLPSNSSLSVYPDNSVASYQTKLETPVSLSGDYECALFELEYTRSWQNIEAEDANVEFTYLASDGRPRSHNFMIPPGFYETVEEICNHIWYGLKNAPDNPRMAIHKYDKLTRKFGVNLPKGSRLRWSPNLMRILGFIDEEDTHLPNHRTCPDSSWCHGSHIADVHRNYRSIYVYSDILEHVPVGDTSAPLLRIAGTSGKGGESVRVIFDTPLYVPIRKKHFDSIQIDLRNVFGDLIPFQGGHSSVTLHIRPAQPFYLR